MKRVFIGSVTGAAGILRLSRTHRGKGKVKTRISCCFILNKLEQIAG
jgi:hypothetical protein